MIGRTIVALMFYGGIPLTVILIWVWNRPRKRVVQGKVEGRVAPWQAARKAYRISMREYDLLEAATKGGGRTGKVTWPTIEGAPRRRMNSKARGSTVQMGVR